MIVDDKRKPSGKYEVFFFPDEENLPHSPSASQVFADSLSSDEDSQSGDFIVVEEEVGLGYMVILLFRSVILRYLHELKTRKMGTKPRKPCCIVEK